LLDSRDFQSAGVGTNINRCVRLHRRGKFTSRYTTCSYIGF
jgi:hypothetical protein